MVSRLSPRVVRLAGRGPSIAFAKEVSCWRYEAMRSAAVWVMPRVAGPDWSWRVAGSWFPPTGTSLKYWLRVTGFRTGLPVRPVSRASTKAAEGCQFEGGLTTTPRAALGEGSSKWTKASPARSCSAPSTGLRGVAVKRALRLESAAAAGTEELPPRFRLKGCAKVRFFTPAEDRSSSFTTTWAAPASCRPDARLLASPAEKDELVSTHSPVSGFRPAVRRMSSPRLTWASISPEMPAPVSAATSMGT